MPSPPLKFLIDFRIVMDERFFLKIIYIPSPVFSKNLKINIDHRSFFYFTIVCYSNKGEWRPQEMLFDDITINTRYCSILDTIRIKDYTPFLWVQIWTGECLSEREREMISRLNSEEKSCNFIVKLIKRSP